MLTVNGILFSSAPFADRSAFADLRRQQLMDMLVELKARTRGKGAVLLSTCDRVEFWLEDGAADGYEPLCRACRVNPLRWKSLSYRKEGDEAISWLFELACGLHSPLFGEDTIISQLEAAEGLSRECGCASPETQQLFRLAVTAAKKVQSVVDVDQCEPLLCPALFALLHPSPDSSVLVIGSSSTARMVASYFLHHGCRVNMTLRDERKTELVPAGVVPVSYDARYLLLPSFPVVICATKGLNYALDEKAEPMEGAVLVDLANPYDIDDRLSGKHHCRVVRDEDILYQRNVRAKNIEQSKRIIQVKIREFHDWLCRETESRTVSSLAEAASQDVLFRMHPVIGRLGLVDEPAFLHTLSDVTYKCIIHQLYGTEKESSLIDLSHPFLPMKALYPGDPDVEMGEAQHWETDGCRVERFSLGSHSMTHIDAAYHLFQEGKRLDQYPLSRFFGMAYVMRGVDDPDIPEEVDMVVVSTGWETKWGTEAYKTGYPVLSQETVRLLLSRGVRLFGFDTPSPDSDVRLPIHRMILASDGLIVENLTGTGRLAGKTVSLTVLPLPFGGDGAPARVIARK